jgi:hypothetical protein
MAHNNGVGDVSTIQTTPPFEIYLAAHVQKVHKMIADHTALTTLASHRLFLLILYPLSPVSQVLSSFSSNHVLHWGSEIVFLKMHHLFWMPSDTVIGGSALCCTASSSA